MSFAIPVKRLRETDTLMAFRHPKPDYPFHALIVPKKAVASLTDLDPADTAFLTDLYSTVQSLVEEFKLPAYRLIVNGGEFQDFPQLHFHCFKHPAPAGKIWNRARHAARAAYRRQVVGTSSRRQPPLLLPA